MPMPRGKLYPLAVLAALALAGCNQSWWPKWGSKPAPPPAAEAATPVDESKLPLHVRGTIGQYARVDRAWDMRLSGYGVVVHLGQNGSGDLPPDVEKYLTDYLAKLKIGSYSTATPDMSPSRILRDKDTATTLVSASVPIGAPVGTRFDVYLSCLPNTQTVSLYGGHLMPAEMVLAPGGLVAPPAANVQRFGECSGPIMCNPFLDPTDPQDCAKMRQARVVGGGVVTRAVPLRLALRQAQYDVAVRIQDRINGRFQIAGRGDKRNPKERVANAQSAQVIELQLPDEFKDDYTHFLDLVMHLPLTRDPSAAESTARAIAREMELPTANPAELALVWEAMGRQSLPVVQGVYASRSSAAAFYAARAALRMGDRSAAEILAAHAGNPQSPQRMEAIEELGKRRDVLAGLDVLRSLVDDESESVRLAAYQALARRGDVATVRRIKLPEFTLDMVASKGSPVIYVSQSMEPRVAVFGRDLCVARPVFFSMPDDLITVDSKAADEKLTIYRLLPIPGRSSKPIKCDADMASFVKLLGGAPELDVHGELMGLGLTYGQIVAVLARMCKEGDIPARFVLQQLPQVEKMSAGAVTPGRPDMPE